MHPVRFHSIFQEAVRYIRTGEAAPFYRLLMEHPELAWSRDLPDSYGRQNTLLHEVTGMAEVRWPACAADMAAYLLHMGAEVDAPETAKGGETPLHHSVSINNVDVARVLLAHGADAERTGRYDGSIDTALGYALFYGNDPRLPRFSQNCPELLIDHGSVVYLPFAAALGQERTVKQFFDAEGRIAVNAGKGSPKQTLNQALLFAAKYGVLEVCEFLLARGADLNQLTPFFDQQATALHLACERGEQVDMVRFLLERGADPSIPDGRYESTPEGWAMFCGQERVFKILKDWRARQ